MFQSSSRELVTVLVTHYASVIHRQRKLYTSLAGLAHEGCMNTRHEYVFFLVAALSEPSAPSNNGWHSFAHLDPANVDELAKFAGMLKCAAHNNPLSFKKAGIQANLDSDTLNIDAFAPTGVMTHSIATALGERAVSPLNDIFSGDQPGELVSLSALLLPPKGALVQVRAATCGTLQPNWHDQTPSGRVH